MTEHAYAGVPLDATFTNPAGGGDATASFDVTLIGMAHAERTITGETLSAVLARYRAGKASSDAELARLSAIEWKSVQAIKAATTAATKQAAFAAINWHQAV